MHIESNFKTDTPADSLPQGGYQWWYFDAIDVEKGVKAVIIFYAANPFSIHYINKIKEMESKKQHSTHGAITPLDFPAISISIYEGKETLFYSFTEFSSQHFSFTENPYNISIGNNRILKEIDDEELVYTIQLSEELPSGDRIEADLSFRSPNVYPEINSSRNHTGDEGHSTKSEAGSTGTHRWNLIQPTAKVQGTIDVHQPNIEQVSIAFDGRGYHDQNTGREPMKNSFSDWYWGRFHFDDYTLVYYAMNELAEPRNGDAGKRSHEKNYNAWLFDNQLRVIKSTDVITLSSIVPNAYGLVSNRVLRIESDRWEATIQQPSPVDNGPFYQRFVANAIIHLPEQNEILASTGFTEYIKPSRIYNRIFWPLVRMRLRRYQEPPHWVQKSPTLYRWTW